MITKRKLIQLLEKSTIPDNALLNVSIEQGDIEMVKRVILCPINEDHPEESHEFCLDLKIARPSDYVVDNS